MMMTRDCGTRWKSSALGGIMALLVCVLLPIRVSADEVSDRRASLQSCVEKHFTPADRSVVRHLMMVMFMDNATPANEMDAAVAAQREPAIADAAALTTRLAESDCHAEVQAVIADKPSGGGFGALFQMMIAPLTANMKTTGALVGLDIVRKMDSTALADLGGLNAPAAAGSTSGAPSAPITMSKTAISGSKLQVDFVTAINADCSLVGQTVVRLEVKPLHGTASVENGKSYTAFPSNNQRYHCNEKSVPGVLVYYQSLKGYMGPDQLTFRVIFPNGGASERSVNISVN